MFARLAHAIQLRALTAPNLFNRFLASIATAIEIVGYGAHGPTQFLVRRRGILGPNFAAMGRLIVGRWSDVRSIIDSPQSRGTSVVLVPWFAFWRDMPRRFLLFVSDKEAGGPIVPATGEGVHAALHMYIWRTLLEPLQSKLWSGEGSELHDELDRFVEDLVGLASTMPQPIDAGAFKREVNRFVVSYTLWSLLGVRPTEDEVTGLVRLFNNHIWIASRNSPFGPIIDFLFGVRAMLDTYTQLVVSSPHLDDYTPGPENNHLTKTEYAALLLSIIGFAAIGGGGVVANAALKLISVETPMATREQGINAILEVTRLSVPVGNITVITQEKTTFTVNGEPTEFPKGTVVSASYVLSSSDPEIFQNPAVFDSSRQGLRTHLTTFSGAGYQFADAPHRMCPGRNISIYMTLNLVRRWREAGLHPTV